MALKVELELELVLVLALALALVLAHVPVPGLVAVGKHRRRPPGALGLQTSQ